MDNLKIVLFVLIFKWLFLNLIFIIYVDRLMDFHPYKLFIKTIIYIKFKQDLINELNYFLISLYLLHVLMMRSAPISPIMIQAALGLLATMAGITEASMTRRPFTPRTLSSESVTAALSPSLPIRHVQEGWYMVKDMCRR